MAKNLGRGSRIGTVKNRTQERSSKTDRSVKRDWAPTPTPTPYGSVVNEPIKEETQMKSTMKSITADLTKERFALNLWRLSGVMRKMLESFLDNAAQSGVAMSATKREIPLYVHEFNSTTGACTSNSVCFGLGVVELVLSDAQKAALSWLHEFSTKMEEIEHRSSSTKGEEQAQAAYDLVYKLSTTLFELDTKGAESAARTVGISLDKMKASDAHHLPKFSDGSFPALWYLTAIDVMPIYMLNHLILAAKSGDGVLTTGILSSPYPSKVYVDGEHGKVHLSPRHTDIVPFVDAMHEMYFFEEFLKYAKSSVFKDSMLPLVSTHILGNYSSYVVEIAEAIGGITPRDVSYLAIWISWLRVSMKFIHNNPSAYVVASSPELISSVCLEMYELMRETGMNPFSAKFIDEIGKFTIEFVRGGAFASGLKGYGNAIGTLFHMDSFYKHILPKPLAEQTYVGSGVYDSSFSPFRTAVVAALKRKRDNIPRLLLFHSYKLFDTSRDLVAFMESGKGDDLDGYFGGMGAIHSRFCTYIVDSNGTKHPLVIPVPVVEHTKCGSDYTQKTHSMWALGICRMIVATSGNVGCLLGKYATHTRYDLEISAPKEVAELLPFVSEFVNSATVDSDTFLYVEQVRLPTLNFT